MKDSANYSVILFYSTNYAIKSKTIFEKNNLDHKMIPVPRHLSSDCGSTIRIKSNDESSAKELLEQNNVEYDRIAILE